METININNILKREDAFDNLKEILINFEKNKHDLSFKRGIYIYGESGTGKTCFILNLLKELNYDVVKYDAGDIRSKAIVDTITQHNMSDKNIMSMFQKKIKQIAIVMDEIDGMNNGDKGGINALIKIIRPKKTKKQRTEDITLNPIICIGNYHIDKKIKELMKVCHVIELKPPTKTQINVIIKTLLPTLDTKKNEGVVNYIQGDLRKIKTIYNIFKNANYVFNDDIISNILQIKSYNDDTRNITKKLINGHCSIEDHLNIMNETDRTIVGLLWHENIVDVLSKMKNEEAIPFYLKVLENICFADYIDRITFQKQIWQFNEMSSLIKTFKNNKLFHDTFKLKKHYNPTEVRFTKVLTKYSTEYNNYIFIQNLCQQLSMDKKDLFAFFLNLKNNHSDNYIISLFENYEITKLDICRIYRYLDKYTKENIIDKDNEPENENDDE
jgi:DNA polymerase III delta prime subunit